VLPPLPGLRFSLAGRTSWKASKAWKPQNVLGGGCPPCPFTNPNDRKLTMTTTKNTPEVVQAYRNAVVDVLLQLQPLADVRSVMWSPSSLRSTELTSIMRTRIEPALARFDSVLAGLDLRGIADDDSLQEDRLVCRVLADAFRWWLCAEADATRPELTEPLNLCLAAHTVIRRIDKTVTPHFGGDRNTAAAIASLRPTL